MRRSLVVLSALVLVLGFVACGDDDDDAESSADEPTSSTQAEEPAPEASEATVSVADSSLGDVLVNGEGRTLYLFTRDSGTTSTCTGGCAQTWPALTAEGEPTAGEGTDESLLGTADQAGGTSQVTYNGHLLYLFSGDQAAGDTNGQGVGGIWFAVTPEGEQAAA